MKPRPLFALAVILFSAIVLSLLHLWGGAKKEIVVAQSPPDQHWTTIERIHDLLLANYIHPLDSSLLVKGAVNGIKIVITKKVKNAEFPSLSSIDNMEQLREFYVSVTNRHRGVVKPDDLFLGTLAGMMKSLNDPYTTYLTPKEYKRLNEIMQGGNFSGVGIYIELDKENKSRLMVVKPIEGTPAYRAGLLAGDYIILIDGQSTEGIDIQRAQDLIRGRSGTKVSLTIERKSENNKYKRHEYTLVRENIHVKSVASKVLDGNLGYVELSTFGEFTGRELEDSLQVLEKGNINGIILDLRNNGGGYITAALEVTSKFLPRGSTVVSVVDRNNKVRSYPAKGSRHPQLPLIVLVNKFSASASEITAGALQDHGRAKLVGEGTFGKASVQTIHPLEAEYGGGALKLTTAKYLTPNGRDIMKKGIAPDVQVVLKKRPKDDSDDLQLKKAMELLKNTR